MTQHGSGTSFAGPGARMLRNGDWCAGGTTVARFVGGQTSIKIRGFRIEPGEIETVLRTHPDVDRAVVVARQDQPGAPRLVAYLVVAPGRIPAVEQLRALLVQTVPAYLVPAAFMVLDALPLSSHGKLDRRALPRPHRSRRGHRLGAPRTETEQVLAQIWPTCSAWTPRRCGQFFALVATRSWVSGCSPGSARLSGRTCRFARCSPPGPSPGSRSSWRRPGWPPPRRAPRRGDSPVSRERALPRPPLSSGCGCSTICPKGVRVQHRRRTAAIRRADRPALRTALAGWWAATIAADDVRHGGRTGVALIAPSGRSRWKCWSVLMPTRRAPDQVVRSS